jgi:serine/threonine-protein kinase
MATTQGPCQKGSLHSRETAPAPLVERAGRVGMLVGDKYRLERLVGQGAMGAVYAALHEPLRKKIAVKILFEEHVGSPVAVRRFFDEARALAGIESEHVARVFDVGVLETGAPFMALELLEGCDLGQVLQERVSLPVPQVIDWILQALEALAEAHALGVVHRDLKPENLFLARRRDGTDTIKVLDFGISKLVRTGAAALALTATSTMLGSPVYMAPEQLRDSKSVDVRADVWAVGVVLYELLTGRLPFCADNFAELFVAVLERAPAPLCTLRPDVPSGLAAVVDRCLSRDVSSRIQNVADLAEALEPFAGAGPRLSVTRIRHIVRTAPDWGSARASPSYRRTVVPKLIAAAMAVATLGGLAAALNEARRGSSVHLVQPSTASAHTTPR